MDHRCHCHSSFEGTKRRTLTSARKNTLLADRSPDPRKSSTSLELSLYLHRCHHPNQPAHLKSPVFHYCFPLNLSLRNAKHPTPRGSLASQPWFTRLAVASLSYPLSSLPTAASRWQHHFSKPLAWCLSSFNANSSLHDWRYPHP